MFRTLDLDVHRISYRVSARFQDAGSTSRILFLMHGHVERDPRIRMTGVRCALGGTCDGYLR
jgi:hypothetical protein